jgi:hypothetical protein
MVLKKTIFSIFLLAGLSAFSATGGSDPNLIHEGNRVIVKRHACLKLGGTVTDGDRRYFICDGGKYDGYITPGPATNCQEHLDQTHALLNASGLPANDSEFLRSAQETLSICITKAKDGGWSQVAILLDTAAKACRQGSDQMSSLYLGQCKLKAADLGQFIMKSP